MAQFDRAYIRASINIVHVISLFVSAAVAAVKKAVMLHIVLGTLGMHLKYRWDKLVETSKGNNVNRILIMY